MITNALKPGFFSHLPSQRPFRTLGKLRVGLFLLLFKICSLIYSVNNLLANSRVQTTVLGGFVYTDMGYGVY